MCRGVEGQRVLEATLTMMTETGEVATSLWTHSTSLEVVKDNLRQVYQRVVSLGRAVRHSMTSMDLSGPGYLILQAEFTSSNEIFDM